MTPETNYQSRLPTFYIYLYMGNSINQENLSIPRHMD